MNAAYYMLPGGLIRTKPKMFMHLVWAWVVERAPYDPDERAQWDLDMADLLPWQGSDSLAAEELESASFGSLQGIGG